MVAVHRSTSATPNDTKLLCQQLYNINVAFQKAIIVSDFNLHTATRAEIEYVQLFALDHNLHQLANKSTRGLSLLDLIFVTHHFAEGRVDTLPKFSNHNSQFLTVDWSQPQANNTYSRIMQYNMLSSILRSVHWNIEFRNCKVTNDFADIFTKLLHKAIGDSTIYKPVIRRERFPKRIVHLLHKKRRVWSTAKRTKDFA